MESTPHAELETAGPAAAEPEPIATAADAAVGDDTLSPAVRRLIRQYDLDVTAIQGTGPAGRIRVGDVIGMLGGRATENPPLKPVERTPVLADLEPDCEDEREGPITSAPRSTAPISVAPTATPTTTVFECDLSRVLAHRKRLRAQNADVLLTSYFGVALADILRSFPELEAGDPATLAFRLTAADGTTHFMRAVVPLEPGDRLRTFDAQLRAQANHDAEAPALAVYHYGASGSVLSTPTPIPPGAPASVGIGRVRREIVVRANEAGEESPRVTAICNLSLSFYTERVAFERAHAFLAAVVRSLEAWPE